MTPVYESLGAQKHAPVLTLIPGVTGYRLAFIGGTVFDLVADYADPGPAWAAYRAAKDAAQTLSNIGAV